MAVIIRFIFSNKFYQYSFLSEASFGLQVLSLPVSVFVSVCVPITSLSAQ